MVKESTESHSCPGHWDKDFPTGVSVNKSSSLGQDMDLRGTVRPLRLMTKPLCSQGTK